MRQRHVSGARMADARSTSTCPLGTSTWTLNGADTYTGAITVSGGTLTLAGAKTGTVTLDLKPGKYVLVCNIEKHYAQGMRSAFTVGP